VRDDQAAAEAGQWMLEHGVGCLPVVDSEGRLVGIVTERDFVRIAVRHLALHA
jgi:CBS domain-containing membrane protein